VAEIDTILKHTSLTIQQLRESCSHRYPVNIYYFQQGLISDRVPIKLVCSNCGTTLRKGYLSKSGRIYRKP